jgi:RNA polymerase sigma factor (sigma-70 family)
LNWVEFHEKGDGTSGEQGRGPFEASDYQELYRFLLRHLPTQEVQDVIQEAYKRFLEIDPKVLIHNPQGYVHRIAWNVVCDFRTRRKNQRVNFDSEKMQQAADNPQRVPVDPLSDQLGASQELEHALEPLPPTQQAILILHKGHGYSNDEIARKTGLSVHTVKKYATEALRQLREGAKGGKPI